MARRMSDEAREHAAYQAGLRTIRQGQGPLYRVRAAQDGRWSIDGCSWLVIDAHDRRSAVVAAREEVANWLGVRPDAFDVEAG